MNLYRPNLTILTSKKCSSGDHKSCDGYLKGLPRKTINECKCSCH